MRGKRVANVDMARDKPGPCAISPPLFSSEQELLYVYVHRSSSERAPDHAAFNFLLFLLSFSASHLRLDIARENLLRLLHINNKNNMGGKGVQPGCRRHFSTEAAPPSAPMDGEPFKTGFTPDRRRRTRTNFLSLPSCILIIWRSRARCRTTKS